MGIKTIVGSSFAALLALAGVGGISACSSDPGVATASSTSAGPSSARLRLVQSDQSAPSGMEALVQGSLVADEVGCVTLRGKDGAPVSVVWPRGYSVRGTVQSFEVVDASATVIARSGTPLDMGGGGSGTISSAWSGRECVADGKVWLVGAVSSG